MLPRSLAPKPPAKYDKQTTQRPTPWRSTSRRTPLVVRAIASPPTKTTASQSSGSYSSVSLDDPPQTISTSAPTSVVTEVPRRARPIFTADQFTSTRSFVEIAFDQVLDSVVDVGRHLQRGSRQLPSESEPDRLMRDGTTGKLRFRKTRPVVLVLGSGWGAHSLIKVIDTDMYDVVVVSPRNHFLFTPMLPSTAVGTVEFRSLVEPIRTSNEFISYFEATCDNIDKTQKIATCTAYSDYSDGFRPTFEVPYDVLVMAVGEQPATFGTKGVAENCCFMKEITDTINVRNRIGKCFELAALPGTTEEDRYRALSFVVVGGGPTGVEFAGTLSDFLRGDLERKYPSLIKYVKVTLLQASDRILTQFAENLQERALESMGSSGVTVRTKVRVNEVTPKQVVLNSGERLDYGLCIWSCGNSSRPLVRQMVESIPEQKELQRPNAPPTTYKLVVDPFLRVIGAEDIIALGDCSLIKTGPLPPTAQVAGQQGAYIAHIINRGYVFGKGGMEEGVPRRLATLGKWRWMGDMLVDMAYQLVGPQKNRQIPLSRSAQEGLASAREHGAAAVLEAQSPSALDHGSTSGRPVIPAHHGGGMAAAGGMTPATSSDGGSDAGPATMREYSNGKVTSETESRALMLAQHNVVPVGSNLKSFDALGSFDFADGNSYNMMSQAVAFTDAWLDYCTRPFEFLSLGIMAYIGNNKALTQIEAGSAPGGGLKLYGEFAFLLWKSVYITKQVSLRNRVLILFDWLKTRVFGRDTSIF